MLHVDYNEKKIGNGVMSFNSDKTKIMGNSFGNKSSQGFSQNQESCYLICIHGTYLGKRYLINPKGTRIGRSVNYSDIVLEKDHFTSRRHALLTFENGEYYLSDLNSRAGTFLNNTRVEEDEHLLLTHGDEIEIGKNIFRFIKGANWDFGFPRKAGVFWVRYRAKLLFAASLLTFIICALFIGIMGNKALILRQKPESGSVLDQSPQPLIQQGSSWSYSPGSHSVHPAISDLNYNGTNDIVFVDSDGKMYVIDTKSMLQVWWSPYELPGEVVSDITVADINRDKVDDIVLVSSNRVLAIDGMSGSEILRSRIIGGVFDAPPAVADLNGDGTNDIVAVATNGNLVFGYINKEGVGDWQIEKIGTTFSIPVIEDVDNDNSPDVVIADDDGFVYVFDGKSHQQKLKFNTRRDLENILNIFSLPANQIRSAPTVYDLNNSGSKEILVQSRQSYFLIYDISSKSVVQHLALGRPQRSLPASHPAPVVLDIDLDGDMDIAIASLDGNIYQLINSGQNKFEMGDIINVSDGEPIVSFSVSDLTKDNRAEYLVVDAKHKIYEIDPFTGSKWESKDGVKIGMAEPLVAKSGVDNRLAVYCVDDSNKPIVFQSKAKVLSDEGYWHSKAKNCKNLVVYNRRVSAKIYYIIIVICILFISIDLFLFVLIRNSRKKLYPVN